MSLTTMAGKGSPQAAANAPIVRAATRLLKLCASAAQIKVAKSNSDAVSKAGREPKYKVTGTQRKIYNEPQDRIIPQRPEGESTN